jgi:hypothetical protein
VPPGRDHNEISGNLVTRNDTVRILLTDACTALHLPPTSCSLGFDPLPERVGVRGASANAELSDSRRGPLTPTLSP